MSTVARTSVDTGMRMSMGTAAGAPARAGTGMESGKATAA